MIAYLIKSAVCLVLLLAAYHILLEKEKTHLFKRFFLLGCIVFGLTMPLITITVPHDALPDLEVLPAAYVKDDVTKKPIFDAVQSVPVEHAVPNNPITLTNFLLIAYLTVAALLLIRFVKNLYDINNHIRNSEQLQSDNCTLVLVTKNIIPHSFFNYVFINKAEYQSGSMDQQMLLHEFTHVNQRHSYDIILLELLRILFWFNPVFIFYKKAIQLNHEFLADEGVLSVYDNLKAYQHLLLSKAGFSNSLNLTSNFNYSITKKRLIMMNKTTSKLRAMLKVTVLAPVIFALICACCIKAKAVTRESPFAFVDTVRHNAKVLFPKPMRQRLTTAHRYKNGNFVSTSSDRSFVEATEPIIFALPGHLYKPKKQSP